MDPWIHGSISFITSTGRRGGRSGVRVYKASRSPDETKRDEMKRSENERHEQNETHRIFRTAEVTCDLQSLDTFFLFTFGRHFRVLARLQKNVHSAERALLRFIFFLRKIAKFCCDLERFPELGTIFRKTNSCGPIVREFELSSYQTQRYAEIWRAFFTSHVSKSFGMFAFW